MFVTLNRLNALHLLDMVQTQTVKLAGTRHQGLESKMNIFTAIKSLAAAAITVVMLSSASAPAQAASYTGIWYDHTGRGAVQISNCGGKLCGRIVWLKDASNNICGKRIIGNVKRMGKVYDRGWIFDPEAGRRYSVELKLLSSSRLRVLGYSGSKMLSETMIWRRAPSSLKRCA
jgi:uncharacterized protein (DUF2147 family)